MMSQMRSGNNRNMNQRMINNSEDGGASKNINESQMDFEEGRNQQLQSRNQEGTQMSMNQRSMMEGEENSKLQEYRGES